MIRTVRRALAGALVALLASCGDAAPRRESASALAVASPVDPARSSLVATPSTAVANGTSKIVVVATARDGSSAPLAGRVVTFNATGVVRRLSGTKVVTRSDGTAQVVLTSTVAGTADVSVSIDGTSIPTHAIVTFVAGSSGAIAFQPQPRTISAGGSFPLFVSVTVGGKPAGGVAVSLSLAGGAPGAVLAGVTSAVTTASGVASFPGLSVSRAGRAYAIVARTASAAAESAAFDVLAGAPSPDGSLVAAPSTAVAGAPPSAITVTVVDPFGNPVEWAFVELASSEPTDLLTSAFTGADGVAVASVAATVAGARSIEAFAEGVPVLRPAKLVVVPAEPDVSYSSAAGPSVPVIADGADVPIAFLIRDAYGNPVPELPVTFSATGGMVSTSAGTTDAFGRGTVFLRSDVVGSATVLVRFAGGVLAAPVTFVPGPAAVLQLTGSPDRVTAGTALPLGIVARDRSGNVATGYRGTVQVRSSDPGAVLPAEVVFGSEDAGQRTVTVALRTAGAQTVTATDAAAATITGAVVTGVAPDAPDRGGSTIVASAASAPDDGTHVTLTVTVRDRYGNPVPGQEVRLSAEGQATVEEPRAATAADGSTVAAVHALAPGRVAVVARVGDRPVAEGEVTFTVAPPDPERSTVMVSPAFVLADGASAATARVMVRDGLGRPIEGAAVSLACSAPADVAPVTGTTDASGLAEFTVTSPLAGDGVLTATAQLGSDVVALAHSAQVEFVETAYPVGGTIAGLASPGLVLASPGLADLAVEAGATSFTFATPAPSGSPYAVVVAVQPDGQTCTVENGQGAAGPGANAIAVTCTGWTSIAAGTLHTLAVRADGTLWAWGQNMYGQLGTGDTEPRMRPVLIGSGFAAVAAGAYHVLAIKADGTLWAWGKNDSGQVGDGTSVQRNAPVQVGVGFRAIAAGFYSSAAIARDGTLFTWGANGGGLLGTGGGPSQVRPCPIGTDYAEVSVGTTHMLAVKIDGTLLAWGTSSWGELGTGTAQESTPTVIGAGYAHVAAGANYTLAVRRDGTLLACGINLQGQLGTGDTLSRSSLTPIGTGYVAAAVGTMHSLALKADGALYAFGRGGEGQLGDGSLSLQTSPVLVGRGFARLAVGYSHSLAVRRDGTLVGWGDGTNGQLGGAVPARSQTVPFAIGAGYMRAAAGASFGLALRSDGALLSWGKNERGELGTGDATARPSPAVIDAGYVTIAAAGKHAFGIKADGSLWGWGENSYSQLGTGDAEPRSAPTRIGSGFVAVATSAYHTVALQADGSLWTWGYNGSGELCTGRRGVAEPAPRLLGAGYVSAAAGDGYTLAVKSDGSLWGCGGNTWGALGTPGVAQAATPVRVGDGYVQVAAGGSTSAGITVDGTLMVWGENGNGQLGLGNTASASAPTPAASGVSQVVVGPGVLMALDTTGWLLAAGDNSGGRLGLGDTAQRTRLAAVGPGFVSVAAGDRHTVGVRSDATLWAWGDNGDGAIGRPSQQPVPVPIPAP